MEGVFRFKSWFLTARGLIHGGVYYRNFTVCNFLKSLQKPLNKCLYIVNCLHQNGYTQTDLDYFFKRIVLSKLFFQKCHIWSLFPRNGKYTKFLN